MRQDVDGSPVSADGDYHALQFNQLGRLKVSTLPGDYVATTGNITTSSSTVAADVSRASNVMVYVTGTFAGVNFTFEGSIDGGTTYFAIQAVRSNANTVELTSGVISAAPVYGWELSVNALTHMRVRATAYTSGTAVVRILPGAYATEPIPAIQTHPVTGSGNFAVTMAAAATTSPAKAEDAVHASSDVGVFSLGVRNDNAATAPTSANGDYSQQSVDDKGRTIIVQKSPTGTATNVSGSASSVTVLAANSLRVGATIYNDSAAILYLKMGATASATSFAVKVAPDGYYEVPAGYTGILDGIWSSATGSARVTELV